MPTLAYPSSSTYPSSSLYPASPPTILADYEGPLFLELNEIVRGLQLDPVPATALQVDTVPSTTLEVDP